SGAGAGRHHPGRGQLLVEAGPVGRHHRLRRPRGGTRRWCGWRHAAHRTADDVPGRSPREIPWFAIGGIDADNLDEVLDAGARRVVVVRAITGAEDPGAAAAGLAARLREAAAERPPAGGRPFPGT
ncbi:thiamine phosphate synthase, partial [Streptomyces alkaliphilus]|uniref:thiamine phosphate synthase n=1 Tax=Streptomyces alkaliphilus TaxID=1472722 RepID=UPI001E33B871